MRHTLRTTTYSDCKAGEMFACELFAMTATYLAIVETDIGYLS